ncbi:MAG: OadG family protein [Selenomonadaceae bacterium]
MGEPITTNAFLIMIINITVVFAVLIMLSYVIRLIHYVDPTVKKASAAKLSTPPVSSEPEVPVQYDQMDEKTLIAVLTTAIMAYGYENVKVTSIRRL